MPIMQEMLDITSAMPGWDNFGFTRSGDRLYWRSAFDQTDDMLSSFSKLTPLMNRMLSGPATMDRVGFVSPADQMQRIQDQTMDLFRTGLTQPEYFKTVEDVQKGFFRKSTPTTRDAINTQCTMQPHYTIEDWDTAKPIMQSIIDQSSKDPACTYFGFHKSGNKLHSQEAFTDGDAMKAHMNAVRPLMEQLKAGPAKLERLEMHGPEPELSKVKDAAAALQIEPEYFHATGAVALKGAMEGTQEPAEGAGQASTAL